MNSYLRKLEKDNSNFKYIFIILLYVDLFFNAHTTATLLPISIVFTYYLNILSK